VATEQENLGIIVYTPTLVVGDSRPLAAVRGMERALTGLRLEWEVLAGGIPSALPQRDAWIAEAVARGKLPLLCNGDESYPVSIFGFERPAGISPGRQPLFELHAELPLDAAVIAAAMDMLEAISEEARAFWGHATPITAGVEIAHQTVDPVHKPGVPPRGLPALKLSEDIRSPEIPRYLGWLNYWSAATAATLGFPDPSRDADLLSRARRTASGGWVVQLTEAPLHLDTPGHLDTLQRTYERFPQIGGRSSP
jgi:hypothetical protein